VRDGVAPVSILVEGNTLVSEDLSASHQDVRVVAICGHSGIPKKRSSMHFQVKWDNGRITWKKYSAVKDCIALDDYIRLHPELEVLNSLPPSVAPDTPVQDQH
jgi:hypothetical protein